MNKKIKILSKIIIISILLLSQAYANNSTVNTNNSYCPEIYLLTPTSSLVSKVCVREGYTLYVNQVFEFFVKEKLVSKDGMHWIVHHNLQFFNSKDDTFLLNFMSKYSIGNKISIYHNILSLSMNSTPEVKTSFSKDNPWIVSARLKDGNFYLFTGYTLPLYDIYPFLCKTTPSGSLVWLRRYDDMGGCVASEILKNSQGYSLLSYHKSIEKNSMSFSLLKVDKNGKEISKKELCSFPYDKGIISLSITLDNSFFVENLYYYKNTKRRFTDLYRFDVNGNLMWKLTFKDSLYRSLLSDGLNDGSCLLVNYYLKGSSKEDIRMIKISKEGKILWIKKILERNAANDVPYVQKLPDGNLLVYEMFPLGDHYAKILTFLDKDFKIKKEIVLNPKGYSITPIYLKYLGKDHYLLYGLTNYKIEGESDYHYYEYNPCIMELKKIDGEWYYNPKFTVEKLGGGR